MVRLFALLAHAPGLLQRRLEFLVAGYAHVRVSLGTMCGTGMVPTIVMMYGASVLPGIVPGQPATV